jgi:peptidoglycan L-alanyl-D-glutamate endopeptidase CwlK
MIDKPTEARIKLLHPSLRDEVTRLVEEANAKLTSHSHMRIIQGLRTFEEQNALYAQGRTKSGPKVTNAKGGQSYHNYGLAIDFCLIIDNKEVSWNVDKDYDGDGMADWMEVVKVFKAAGWTWGADWDNDGKTKAQGDKDEKLVDAPHFQKTFGFDDKELLVKYNNKDFIQGTNYVKLTK